MSCSLAGRAWLVGRIDCSGRKRNKGRATRAGFDAHLTKPADAAALAGIVALAPRAVTRKKRAASVSGARTTDLVQTNCHGCAPPCG